MAEAVVVGSSKADSVEKIIILASLKTYFALTHFFNQNNFIRD